MTTMSIPARCIPSDLTDAVHRSSEKRRHQFLFGRHLARGLLPAGEWRLGAGSDGRPEVFDAAGGSGPDLSISHSGAWVAAAIADVGRVGLDIELPRAGRDFRAIAETYLSPAEHYVVSAEGEPAMLAFWTLREALAKAVGDGLSLALSLDGDALVGARSHNATVTLGGRAWAVAHRSCGALQLALAWSGPVPAGMTAEMVVAAALDVARSSIQSAN